MRTFWTDGTHSQILRASSTSSGFGNAEAGAAIRRRLHRRDDLGMRVAENRRAPGADVIDVAVAVDVLDRAP
jgi:hypothetical protein